MSGLRTTQHSSWWITALILYVAMIFFASSRPHLVPPGPDFMIKDKIAHMVEYMLLGMLLFKVIGWRVSASRVATFVFILAIGATVGALDEILQGHIPHRRMDPYDWWADMIGVAMGVGLFVLTRLGKQRSETIA